MTRIFPSLVVFLALVLISCGSKEMTDSDIKQNPEPRMRYEITLTIKDAPGAFNSIVGGMNYEVINPECSPEDSFSGTYGQRPKKRIPFDFKRVSDNVYAGVVYLDLLLDDDYFGLGVCHWRINMVGAVARANDIGFSSGLTQDEIVEQKSSTLYFPKSGYGDAAMKNTGVPSISDASVLARYPGEFFSITISAKERFE